MIIKHALFTEKGIREINQDAVFAAVEGNHGVFVVADGMGGHSEGEYASAEIALAIKEWWDVSRKYNDMSCNEVFEQCMDAVLRVNKELYRHFKAKEEIGGSTLVLLLVWNGEVKAVSVGDSRIYRIRGSAIEQITIDDVWENTPAAQELSYEERLNDSRRGKLVSAVGVYEEVVPRIYPLKYYDGDIFILCSDGVYKYCDAEAIRGVFGRKKRSSIKSEMKRLKKTVEKKKTKDNYSAIICET